MKLKLRVLAASFALALLGPSTAAAAPMVVLASSNDAIDAATFSFMVNVNVITTQEAWTGVGPGVLEILLEDGVGGSFTLVRNITIATGDSWAFFSSEILDPPGQPNDSDDLVPQPDEIAETGSRPQGRPAQSRRRDTFLRLAVRAIRVQVATLFHC